MKGRRRSRGNSAEKQQLALVSAGKRQVKRSASKGGKNRNYRMKQLLERFGKSLPPEKFVKMFGFPYIKKNWQILWNLP